MDIDTNNYTLDQLKEILLREQRERDQLQIKIKAAQKEKEQIEAEKLKFQIKQQRWDNQKLQEDLDELETYIQQNKTNM